MVRSLCQWDKRYQDVMLCYDAFPLSVLLTIGVWPFFSMGQVFSSHNFHGRAVSCQSGVTQMTVKFWVAV
jgi:hypothetical protein